MNKSRDGRWGLSGHCGNFHQGKPRQPDRIVPPLVAVSDTFRVRNTGPSFSNFLPQIRSGATDIVTGRVRRTSRCRCPIQFVRMNNSGRIAAPPLKGLAESPTHAPDRPRDDSLIDEQTPDGRGPRLSDIFRSVGPPITAMNETSTIWVVRRTPEFCCFIFICK